MTNKSDEKEVTGVRAKLAKHKAANQDSREVTLPECGIVCQIPKFINHGLVMASQRQAKGDMAMGQTALVAQVVKFEGEKLNLADLRELLDGKDMLFLIGEVFGGDDDDDAGDGTDDVGNDTAAA